MNLDVPVVIQEENSEDCGIASISMILKYYGMGRSIEELKKEIKVYKGTGTYAPQIGEYLINQGFDVEIVSLNPHLFTNQFKEKSQEEIKEYIEELHENISNEKFKEQLRLFIDYFKAGGKLTVKLPTIKDIEEELELGRPVGAILTSNFLLHDKAGFNFHFNVVTGFDEENVYANDPLPDQRGGKKKYKKEDFMYGIYACAFGDLDNASIIKIRKK